MTNTSQANPLAQFYRVEKLYVALPSQGAFYDEGVIELNENKEVGVKAMTAADEVLFRNPDALLNGEAVKRVISSCVPAVKKPEHLLANDIDTLIIAIRHASYGDSLDIQAVCPECKKENSFSLSMENTLSTLEKLEETYPVELSVGLTAYIRPNNFTENVKAVKKSFEQENIVKNIENPSFSEEQKMKMLGDSIDVLAKLNFDVVADSVQRVTNGDDINVTDRKHINEFISNVGREDANKIQKKLEKINSIGIKKSFDAQCEDCQNKWSIPVDFNPATFFTESLQD